MQPKCAGKVFLFSILAMPFIACSLGNGAVLPRPMIVIPQVLTKPVIDGKIQESEWREAVVVPYTLLLNTWKDPAHPTRVIACYTESALYLAFDCTQEKIPAVGLETSHRDGDVFHQDCVELFVQLREPVYYHFSVGINGATYEAMLEIPGHPVVSWNGEWRSALGRRPGGWVAELEIPFAAFGESKPSPGSQWRVNFCRENRSDGEFSSWSPVGKGFHEPDRFGTVVFGADVPLVGIRRFTASPNGVIETVGEVANHLPKPVSVQIERQVSLDGQKRVFSLPLLIEPRDTQKFQLVDEVQDEGKLCVVFEASVNGMPFYRLVRPFEVPPIRTRLRNLSARLKVLSSLVDKLPKGTSAKIASDIESLKARRDQISKAVVFIPESTPGQLQWMMKALDVLERGVGINEFLVHLQQLKTSIQPGAEFIVWPADPWVQVKPFDLPRELPHDPEIRVLGFRDESVYFAVNVTNLSDRSLDLRVIIGELSSGMHKITHDRLELREAVFVKEEAETENLVGDALPLLNDAGKLTIPSGQTGQLFVRIRTEGLEAGEYCGHLSVGPLTGGATQAIKVTVTVYPFRLPENPRPWICSWGGILNISWATPDPQAYLRDAVDHGVNVFLISPYLVAPSLNKEGRLARPIDYAKHDELVRAYRPYGMVAGIYSIGLIYDEWAKKTGIEYLSPAYRSGFITWVKDWIEHLKGLGLDYQDFAFEVVDEPASEAKFKLHMDIGRLLREADPKARVLVTANTKNLDYLRQLAEVVDIWVPHSSVLEDELCRKLMESTGKEMWVYVCSGDSKRLDPVGYYRSLAWQAFRRNLKGWGYFAHMWWGEIPWESSNTTKKYLATYSTVYPGTHGPVPSRRWEAFRKGIEDFKALHLLKTLISEAEKAGRDVSFAKATMAEAIKAWDELKAMDENRSPTSERSAFLEEIRRKIAVACVKLQ